jgi:hypothetical protein
MALPPATVDLLVEGFYEIAGHPRSTTAAVEESAGVVV